jgi:RNA polymerase sigma-70 factor (ECF subfamily)
MVATDTHCRLLPAGSGWADGRARRGASNGRRHSDVDWVRLIGAVAEREDREAFARLFDFFAPRVKGLLIRNGTSSELAEEIAQETLLRVWRKAAQFDPGTTGAAAWIFTIARNLRIDAIRSLRENVSLDEVDPSAWLDDALLPDERVQARQQHARVERALAMLADDQLKVIRESYYEDKSHGDIAAETGLPLGTVKSRLRLAIGHLRGILDDGT